MRNPPTEDETRNIDYFLAIAVIVIALIATALS
jgi:hypothetical protein